MQKSFEKIHQRKSQGLHRSLSKPFGVDFCSNDYLGLSLSKDYLNFIYPEDKLSVSGQSSRLIRGNHQQIVELELKLAEYSGAEESLYFVSGYQANLAALSAIAENFEIYSDQQNHASLIDGIKLSKVNKNIYEHNNFSQLSRLLREKQHNLIVCESMYSMRGDQTDLGELLSVLPEENSYIYYDQAHTTGLSFIQNVNRRLINKHQKKVTTMQTAGKALAVSGAWISCSREVKEAIVNFGRSFIYSTSPSPLMCTLLSNAIDYIQDHGEELSQKLMQNCAYFKKALSGFVDLHVDGPIFFIPLGDNHTCIQVVHLLGSENLDVRAIRYPTVAKGEEGLRISIHANHTTQQISKLVSQLQRYLKD